MTEREREITSWETKQSRKKGDNGGKGRKAKTKQGEAKKRKARIGKRKTTIFEQD